MYRRFTFLVSLSVFLSLLISTTVFGQATDASIVGTVKGIDGGVHSRSHRYGPQRSNGLPAQHNLYRRRAQAPLGGPYTITVSYIGFANQVRSGYRLSQGSQVVYLTRDKLPEIRIAEI